MPSVTRRGFITRTSLGVAAIGALSAIAPLPVLADSHTAPAPPVRTPEARVPAMPGVAGQALSGGQPFVVYINDPATGAGTILVGEQAIPFTNAAIVQSLHQAIG